MWQAFYQRLATNRMTISVSCLEVGKDHYHSYWDSEFDCLFDAVSSQVLLSLQNCDSSQVFPFWFQNALKLFLHGGALHPNHLYSNYEQYEFLFS